MNLSKITYFLTIVVISSSCLSHQTLEEEFADLSSSEQFEDKSCKVFGE